MGRIKMLISNRWSSDQLVYLHEYGSYYWLKPLFKNGKRVGITSCCENRYECERHKKIKEIIANQKKNSN